MVNNNNINIFLSLSCFFFILTVVKENILSFFTHSYWFISIKIFISSYLYYIINIKSTIYLKKLYWKSVLNLLLTFYWHEQQYKDMYRKKTNYFFKIKILHKFSIPEVGALVRPDRHHTSPFHHPPSQPLRYSGPPTPEN